MITRREFLDTLAVSAAGMAISSTAKSYAQILGANERINFAIIGNGGRSGAHLASIKANQQNARITHICDPDANRLQKFAGRVEKVMGAAPIAEKDFRKVLAEKNIDAITVATPDHWHTPMAIYGLEAGKHVYVEKPCSQNPAEVVMLVAARDKYKKLVQMGNQRRSSVGTSEAIAKIKGGVIGRPYYAKAWYSNTRKSIGVGKEVPVPSTLDWDLWQGPAPRRPYKDNVHPYNWHWFWNWGTGETLNNGTHEIDVCRWALGADYPKSVSASGGRYAFKDDWQFYDTLVTNFEYGDKSISWEGLCCNGVKSYGRDRGSLIVGTEGSMMIDQEDYETYDLQGKKTGSFKAGNSLSSSDLTGSDGMTDRHFRNFIAAIRTGEKLNSPIEVGGVAVMMLLLSNVAWKLGRPLKLDTTSAHVLNDPEAMKYWGRQYEKGWAPKI